MINAAAVKSNSGGPFDFEVSASISLSPVGSGLALVGRRSAWRLHAHRPRHGLHRHLLDAVRRQGHRPPPEAPLANHDISFGVHGDQFHLNNPVWLTTQLGGGHRASHRRRRLDRAGHDAHPGALGAGRHQAARRSQIHAGHSRRASGRRRTAITSQSATSTTIGRNRLRPATAASLLPIYQPNLYHTRFSPKGSLEYGRPTTIGRSPARSAWPTASRPCASSTIFDRHQARPASRQPQSQSAPGDRRSARS